jgi:DNA-binding HxlR family transcriptional regulator
VLGVALDEHVAALDLGDDGGARDAVGAVNDACTAGSDGGCPRSGLPSRRGCRGPFDPALRAELRRQLDGLGVELLARPPPPARGPRARCNRGDADLRRAFEFLGRRWNGVVLGTLLNGPAGFRELSRAIDGISDSVLSERLASLVRGGLLSRSVDEGPPLSVAYELSCRRRSTSAGGGLRTDASLGGVVIAQATHRGSDSIAPLVARPDFGYSTTHEAGSASPDNATGSSADRRRAASSRPGDQFG